MKRRAWLILGLLCSLALQAAPRTEILQLHYRTAEELLPLAQSVLGDEGHVSAWGNQLIVKAETARIAELQELLQQLDTPPRRLLISVDNQQDSSASHQGYRVDGSIDAGNVEIVGGRGERHGRDQVRIINRSQRGNSGSLQQVQATEGYPALIQVGQSVPLTRIERDAYGYPREHTEYRDLNRGFEVVASVQGERVQLSIRSQQDRLGQQPGVIDTQSTDTRIGGRLGEWIELGGIGESASGSRAGLLSQQHDTATRNTTLRLKIELLE